MGGRGGTPMRARSNEPAPQTPSASDDQTALTVVKQSINSYDAHGRMEGYARLEDVRRNLAKLGWDRDRQDAELRKLAPRLKFAAKDPNSTALVDDGEAFVQDGKRQSWVKIRGSRGR